MSLARGDEVGLGCGASECSLGARRWKRHFGTPARFWVEFGGERGACTGREVTAYLESLRVPLHCVLWIFWLNGVDVLRKECLGNFCRARLTLKMSAVSITLTIGGVGGGRLESQLPGVLLSGGYDDDLTRVTVCFSCVSATLLSVFLSACSRNWGRRVHRTWGASGDCWFASCRVGLGHRFYRFFGGWGRVIDSVLLDDSALRG